MLYGQRYCKLNDEEFTGHIKSDIVGFVESEASEAGQLSLKGNSLIHKTIRPRENKCIDVQISPSKKLFFSCFAAEHPLREKIFFAEKNKSHFFRGEFFPRNFAEILRESPRRHSARFLGETPRNREC